MGERIRITKVVTKNFVLDWWARLQNMFGFNLTTYENMIDKGMQQIDDEIAEVLEEVSPRIGMSFSPMNILARGKSHGGWFVTLCLLIGLLFLTDATTLGAQQCCQLTEKHSV